MRLFPATLAATGMLFISSTGFAAVRPHHHTSTHAFVSHSASAHARRSEHTEHAATPGISSERATEIQSALIQRGYLSGEPTGAWDASTASAMQKLQEDNGWQTKLVPDSRALIKLGLGPNSNPSAVAGIPADGTSTN